MPLDTFHPMIQRWFRGAICGADGTAAAGLAAHFAGEHTLIAAPTGSGKTLTAFLAAIDRLLKEAVGGTLTDEIRVVYVSPLRALSNDMHRNLEVPLAEITALASAEHPDMVDDSRGTADRRYPRFEAGVALAQAAAHSGHDSRIAVPAADERQRARPAAQRRDGDCRRNPRPRPRQTRFAPGADSRTPGGPLSASPCSASASRRRNDPIDEMARFLVGRRHPKPGESDLQRRPRAAPSSTSATSAISIWQSKSRPSELGAVCMHEQWAEINARLCELIQSHRSTLIFVNTRRMAERRHAPPDAIAGRRRGQQPSRLAGGRPPARYRTAAEDGPVEGRRRHGVARAGPRHRLHRPGGATGLAPVDRHVSCNGSAARGMRWAWFPKAGCSP